MGRDDIRQLMASFMIRPPGMSKNRVVDLTWSDVNDMTLEQMMWWVDYIDDLRRREKGHEDE